MKAKIIITSLAIASLMSGCLLPLPKPSKPEVYSLSPAYKKHLRKKCIEEFEMYGTTSHTSRDTFEIELRYQEFIFLNNKPMEPHYRLPMGAFWALPKLHKSHKKLCNMYAFKYGNHDKYNIVKEIRREYKAKQLAKKIKENQLALLRENQEVPEDVDKSYVYYKITPKDKDYIKKESNINTIDGL